jgi:hypothetical protein
MPLILPRMTVTEGADPRAEGVLQLAKFLEGGRLKNVVAILEYDLASADRNEVEAATGLLGWAAGLENHCSRQPWRHASNSAESVTSFMPWESR